MVVANSESRRIDLKRMAKFALVGVANTAVDFAVFSLLFFWLDWNLILANSLAFCAGVINSFVLNSIWTFRGEQGRRAPLANLNRYFLVSLVGLGISNLVVWLLAAPLTPIGAKLVAVLGSYTWNYAASRRFVFSDRT